VPFDWDIPCSITLGVCCVELIIVQRGNREVLVRELAALKVSALRLRAAAAGTTAEELDKVSHTKFRTNNTKFSTY
jgi:hypothetical protein